MDIKEFKDKINSEPTLKEAQNLLQALGEPLEICFDLSDTFHYASADGEVVDGEDVPGLFAFIRKYGYMAVVAYTSLVRGYDPEVCDYNTPELQKIKGEILEITLKGDHFEGKSIWFRALHDILRERKSQNS